MKSTKELYEELLQLVLNEVLTAEVNETGHFESHPITEWLEENVPNWREE
jgi:hypothetical protein